MKISITSPFVGKSFCFLEYAKTLDVIIKSNPHIEFVFSVLDNSNKPSFEKRIKDLATKLDVFLHYAKEETPGIMNVGMNRMERVNMIYNRLIFEVMPQDIEYCLVIEDDITFDDPEAIRKCLSLMEDPLVATVTANTLARWDRGRFGKPQCSQYFGTDLRQIPLELSGVRQVSTGAMGFWFTRMPILKEIGLPLNINGRKATDGCWSENLINHGYKFMIDQSIHCRHYYQRDDGIVNYVSPTHNTEGKIGIEKDRTSRISSVGYTLERTDRKGSPQFIKRLKINYGK